MRLFCFPYIGGGINVFRGWHELLPHHIELYPVELPGHGARIGEQPFDRLKPLVEAAAQSISPLLDKPFAVFGHSMGALVGFEVVRKLRRDHGALPLSLFMSACRAPHIPDEDPPIHTLPEEEFIEELERYEGTPEQVLKNPELMEIFLPVLRADFAACETYAYSDEPPLECPIHAMGGLEDKIVNLPNIREWGTQTSDLFSMKEFPGGHFFLHDTQEDLVRFIEAGLEVQAPHREEVGPK